MDPDLTSGDFAVRLAAFSFLEELSSRSEDGSVGWTDLTRGFFHEGRRITLAGQRGIWKPAGLELPISIRTAPPRMTGERPYDDEIGADGLLRYRYFGSDPGHPDNRGLRDAMVRDVPLIYLWGAEPGVYFPEWPVFIVGDDPGTLTFTVAFDRTLEDVPRSVEATVGAVAEARRRYVTTERVHRLHQRGFRRQVLRAYREICAVCTLRHRELLEASHILPDTHPRGEPVIPNGISLCTLHHRAYDQDVIGIMPDYRIEIRDDVLEEEDGPMLVHGLQEFQGERIRVPRVERLRPDPDRLAERHERFRKAG